MVNLYQEAYDADNYVVALVKNWSAENDDAENNADHHNDIKQYLGAGKAFIFCSRNYNFPFHRA